VDLTNAEILKTAYARAIALDPDLLLVEHALERQCLLDAQVFMKSLKEWALRDDKSVLIVTYEPERYVDFIDRFIMLYEGRIVFSGSREDFLAERNEYLHQYRASSMEGPMKVL
jgi:lipopolysaccharide export system ATP-binding protein